MAAGFWWLDKLVSAEVMKMTWEAVAVTIGALALLGGLIAWLLSMNGKIDSKQNKKDHDDEFGRFQENFQSRFEILRQSHAQIIDQVYGRMDANRTETQVTLNRLMEGQGELKGMISVLIKQRGQQ